MKGLAASSATCAREREADGDEKDEHGNDAGILPSHGHVGERNDTVGIIDRFRVFRRREDGADAIRNPHRPFSFLLSNGRYVVYRLGDM